MSSLSEGVHEGKSVYMRAAIKKNKLTKCKQIRNYSFKGTDPRSLDCLSSCTVLRIAILSTVRMSLIDFKIELGSHTSTTNAL